MELMYGLKPVPFNDASFSAGCQARRKVGRFGFSLSHLRDKNKDVAKMHLGGTCSLFPIPCSLLSHGSRRRVWRAEAATAGGVNGKAKVVPLYQSFHWSRK